MTATFNRRVFLAAGAAAVGCSSGARPGFSGFAFVANEEGRAIACVDLTAFVVVKHIALPGAPTRLIGNSARQTVYALTPESGTVHEISTTKLNRARWTSVCRNAVDMHSVSADAVWVLGRDPWELVEVGIEKMETRRRISLPHAVADFDLSVEEPRAVVSFADQGQVGNVDLLSGKIQLTDAGSPIRRVRFRKDGRQWIAAHRDEKLLTIVDAASGRIVVRLPLAMIPENLCFKADGGELYITGTGSDAVAIVFPYSTEVAETILGGHTPGVMACLPKTKSSPEFLFVTNPKSRQVTIFNIEDRKVAAVVQVGSEPSHVTITPDNTFALVLNRASGDMAILTRSVAKKRAFPATLLTVVPVGSKPVDAVVQAV